VPTITIPDATYEALSRKAAAVGLSTDEYIALTLSTATPVVPTTKVLEGEAWWKAFEEFNREVQARARLDPPGFELDVSREAMYPDPNGDGR
jgi:hypothetical protein